MQQSEEGAERPAGRVDRDEDRVVDEREHLAGRKVQQIADGLGACAIGRDGGAEQERQVDAREAELVGRAQGRRQHERADEAAGERSPDAHRTLALAIETAALTSARCTRPWGVLPKCAFGVRIELLGVEPDVVGERDQLFHELGGLVEASDPGERVGEPERAAQEGALRAAQAVLSAVAGDQRTVPEMALQRRPPSRPAGRGPRRRSRPGSPEAGWRRARPRRRSGCSCPVARTSSASR